MYKKKIDKKNPGTICQIKKLKNTLIKKNYKISKTFLNFTIFLISVFFVHVWKVLSNSEP